jgi:hypothetical protein
MKNSYTTATIIAAWMLTMTFTGTAQTQSEVQENGRDYAAYTLKSCDNIQTAIRNYMKALRSDNDGVVESALFYSALLKRDVPKECFSCLKREIDKLANEGRTERIRHKAYLVRAAFENPRLMRSTATTLPQSPDELFTAISDALQKAMFDESPERAGHRI